MAIGTTLNAGEIYTRVASLVVDVAGEIPVQLPAASGDGRVGCFGDDVATALIDLLEKEGYIVSCCVPTPYVQRVLLSSPRPHGWVVKIGEVVVETMDNDGRGLNISRMITSWGCAANGQGETKCEETNAGHEGEDDTDETDFLSPGPLLLGSSNATTPEYRGRYTTGNGEAEKEPPVFWTGTNRIQQTAVLLREGVWVDVRILG